MYLGPGMADIGLFAHTTFRNGAYPRAVQERINENPSMVTLFVPTEVLARTVADLKVPTSAISQVYAYYAKKFAKVAPITLV
jgi:hypothetical protein